MKKIILDEGCGIRVEMDPEQIFPKDPGMGTPVLVVWDNGNTGTWNCVTSEGANVDGDVLTEEQKKWLDSITGEVEQWMEENGV